jgi:hypothetical protein
MPSAENPSQIAFQQRNASGVHRDVRPGPHGNADIGLRECWCVVHAISCHCDDVSSLLMRFDNFCFFVRKDIGFECNA